MTSFGPENLTKLLSSYLSKIEVSESLAFLNNHKEKLDQYHRHVFLSSVWKENEFAVFSMVDTSGRRVLGISLTNPFEKNLSLYNAPLHDSLLTEIFVKLFEIQPQFSKAAVVRLPFQSRVLAVVGETDFLEKEILKEKVHGFCNFLFAQKITPEVYAKFRYWNGKKVDFAEIHLLNDFVACVLSSPKGIDQDHIPLLSEIARIYRPKYGNAYQGNVGKFGNHPILTVFAVDYEQLLKEMDLEKRCSEFCRKILQAYELVIKLA